MLIQESRQWGETEALSETTKEVPKAHWWRSLLATRYYHEHWFQLLLSS